MAFSSVIALLLVLTTTAVEVQAQVVACHNSRNCQDTNPFSIDLALCQTQFFSYVKSEGNVCINFRIKFGFEQSVLVGREQGADFSINMGFLEGRHDQQIEVTVLRILGTAGDGDVSLITPSRIFPPRSSTQPVTFALRLDSVAQERDETFSLKLMFDRSLFGPEAEIFDELNVTIIDGESIGLRFSENDYRADEGIVVEAPVRIVKDGSIRLANPVTLRITPLTVDDALAQGVIPTFTPEADLTPPEILQSPLRANTEDFNTASFDIEFPADEGVGLLNTLDVPIPIVDDDLNEREEQYFITRFEIVDAINPDGLNIIRDVATVVIGDNDDIHIGFSREIYEYFEPSSETNITNVTLVKDDNRVSEQTFRVGIVFSDPASVRPATLLTNDTMDSWDYSIQGKPNQTFVLRDILPANQSVTVSFILNEDDIPEGLEGFLLTPTVVTNGTFPQFLLPLATSTTAFQSTTITIIDDDVTIVGWEQTSYTTSEANPLQEVCVIVKNPGATVPLVFDIHLQYQSTIGTAGPTDFIFTSILPITVAASPASTEDPPTERRQCVNVFIINDMISEETESFTLELSFTDTEVDLDPQITEIFIVDDDAPITIGFIDETYQVNETEGVVFVEVGLIGGTQLLREVPVLLSFSDGSAMNGTDYSAPAGGQILQFGPGNTSFTVPLTIVNDSIFELTESLQAILSFPDGGDPPLVFLDPGVANITIFDDDDVPVIGIVPADYSANEGDGVVAFMVELMGGVLANDVMVEFYTESGSAEGFDYENTVTTITFGPGVSALTVNVPILDDDIAENIEMFSANLRLPAGSTDIVFLDPDRANATILDNDVPVIGFERTQYSVVEGDTAPTEVCVALMSPPTLDRTVTVSLITTDGTAEAPDDYNPISAELIFDSDADIHCVNITTNQDSFLEGVENFTLVLASDDDVLLLPEEAEVLILDTTETVFVMFAEPSYTFSEEDGTGTIELVKFGSSLEPFTVRVFGGPSNQTDIERSADGIDIIVEFQAGPSAPASIFINFTLTDDEVALEADETYDVSFEILSLQSVVQPSLPQQTQIIVPDMDGITIGFFNESYQVNEAEGVVFVEVGLIGEAQLQRDVPVLLSFSDGSAMNGNDYSAPVGGQILQFGPGNTSFTVPLTLLDDEVFELTEDLLAILSFPNGNGPPLVLLDPGMANITIFDDDDVPVIGIVPADYSVNEGDGFVTFMVELVEGVLADDIMVEFYTESGSAEGFDYEDTVTGITFGPGVSVVAVNVTILDDDIAENAEMFSANLRLPAGSTDIVFLDPDRANATILDNDVPVIGFEQTQYSVVEGDTTPTEICVALMPPTTLDRTVTVLLITTDGTAEAPDDYNPISVELIFDSDTDIHCVNITTNQDSFLEGVENFTLVLASDDDVLLLPEEAEVLISDRTEAVLVMFAEPSYTFNEEDGTGTIELVKSGSSLEPFTIRVFGGPSDQSDIERSAGGINTVVEFQAGPSAPDSIFINFTLTDDEVALEADETYDVSFEILSLQSVVQPSSPQQTQIIVLDMDVVNVGFGRPSVTVNESDGEFMMCVLKDRETVFPVEVTISTSSDTATEGEDYDPANVPSSVTIPADEDMACFTTDTVLDDQIALEEDETLLLSIENVLPDDPNINITDGSTIVTLLDDDIVLVEFEQATYNVIESTGVAEVCLVKNAETAESFEVVGITTAEGTATEGSDYTQGPYSVTFGTDAGDRQCINIPVVTDDMNEGSEDFSVVLAASPASNQMVLSGDLAMATVNIIDPDNTILVNDTVIGDPLFTVPIYVSEDQLQDFNLPRLSLCYEIHGQADQWFNLVTDECSSVNARYVQFSTGLNVIDEIGVRAVDNADQCVNIRVDVGNCTADVNNVALNVMGRYSMNGVSVRRYRNRVRISVPNCNDLTLVMWVFCETRTLEDHADGSEVTGDMIKFVVMRGLNMGNRPSHGLLGQFWNIPVSIAPYTGLLRDGSPSQNQFVINITTSGSDPPVQRSYTGWLFDLTWDYKDVSGPCLYVGNKQGGPIYEVKNPNDNVIEEIYAEYKVGGAFSEDGYGFGIFMEERCSDLGVTALPNN